MASPHSQMASPHLEDAKPSSSSTDANLACPGWPLYAGLFLITLATLLFELGLTRIFSVIMYYHMAFFAISVTLFGMAFGGVIVHFLPKVFTAERAQLWMARMALAFGASTAAVFAVILAIPFDITRNSVLAMQLLCVSVLLALPFTFSGVAVGLALTRFPRRTNLLYGFDLAGAALGALLFAPLITNLGGPGFILALATLMAAAAVLLCVGQRVNPALARRRLLTAVMVTLALGALAANHKRLEIFQVRHLRGATVLPKDLAFDGWNVISRVVAYPDTGHAEQTAPQFYDKARSEQYTILIDMFAATPIYKFDGRDFSGLFYPFHDISYPVHAIKKNARVAIIGTGGGRDVLAAKAWGQPEVLGIDINSRVIEAFTRHFADFAGQPLKWPGVTIVNDEARSRITRSKHKFDIIQASLIDTFAATAAGAFVLTENALYTVEGWNLFLDQLNENGILTMSRWYTPGNPIESIRLLALARSVLEGRGIKNPQAHILMARTPNPLNLNAQPTATILVKTSPFTAEEVDTFDKWVQSNFFLPLVTPHGVFSDELRGVMNAPDLKAYVRTYPFDISPPTDDRPFFFNVLRWGDIFKKEFRQGSNYIISVNLKPLIMLGSLLFTVVVMAFAFIVVPLLIQGWRRGRQADEAPLGRRFGMMFYFVLLGLGYITIELTLMQRFSVFLGHPSYSLTVCLFTMLLASGLGAAAGPRIFRLRPEGDASGKLIRLNMLVFAIQLVTLIAAVWTMRHFASSPNPVRILLAGSLIAPAAFFMGMPFPLAIQAASARSATAPLAWYWGLNGAFSVCASVLTVALAHTIGLSGAFLIGACCYLLAALASRSFGPAKA